MKHRVTAIILACLAVAVTAQSGAGQGAPPTTPAPVNKVLHVQPLRFEQPFDYAWRRERPVVRGGYLLVLQVDPQLVVPRQGAHPVLYVGNQIAQRFNAGAESGRVVVFVPSGVDDTGRLTLDIVTAPIWFGDGDLPERVDAARVEAQRRKAEAARVGRRPAGEVEALLEGGGAPRVIPDQEALFRAAGALVQHHAPDERDCADVLLATGRDKIDR